MKIFLTIQAMLSIIAMLLAGCVAPGQTTSTAPSTTTTSSATQAAKTGLVQVWVTDAPRSDNISEIWVTVSDVKIHEANVQQASGNVSGETEGVTDNTTGTNSWISANLTGPERFDLLTLRGDNGGLEQILATANLPVGRYTQIRMSIEKVEVNAGGVLHVAVLSGGSLKFVHPFDVQAESVTKLLFDFDADKLVNVTGSTKNPKYIVKPVVKLIVSKPVPAVRSNVQITTTNLPNGAVGSSYNVTLSDLPPWNDTSYNLIERGQKWPRKGLPRNISSTS